MSKNYFSKSFWFDEYEETMSMERTSPQILSILCRELGEMCSTYHDVENLSDKDLKSVEIFLKDASVVVKELKNQRGLK